MSSWTLIEDLTLCESWVRTTHDPSTGNEMDKREMWSKITKAFCDVHGKDSRTSQGLQGRWKKTQRIIYLLEKRHLSYFR